MFWVGDQPAEPLEQPDDAVAEGVRQHEYCITLAQEEKREAAGTIALR